MMYSRLIHCEETGKYRVQLWRWFLPFWLTQYNYGEGTYPLEFNSEAEARQWLYERDMNCSWRVI